MTAGRKPIPSRVKRLAGTWRKDRARPDEPAPAALARIPPAPEWLSAYGRAAWARVAAVLVSTRVLTGSDLELLAVLSEACGQHEEVARALRGKGGLSFVTLDSDGSPKSIELWPEIKILKDSAALVARLACEFGLSPSSRTRVAAIPKPAPPDGFEEFDRSLTDGVVRVDG